MTSPAQRCPKCGSPLQAAVAEGLCPGCLWRSLDDAEDDAPPGPLPSPPRSAGLLELPGHTVLAELARGGMGIVYRARQHAPAREVALKMLLPHQLGSADMRERFRIEVRACAALDHPAILPIHEVGEWDGQPFFTMKLAAGGTLAARRDRYRGRWRELAELVATLADAVQFAHARGVLHRDVKPGNVLFDEADRPYLSDFGLAKFTGEDSTAFTRSLITLGTPHYLAPEVARSGAKQATTASDLYALGAILYELLAGRPPFVAESVPDLLRKIAEEEPGKVTSDEWRVTSEGEAGHAPGSPPVTCPPSPVPRDLELIARKCLRKEPDARYVSAATLAEDLRRWLGGEPVHAKPVTRTEIIRAWSRRNPALAAVSVLLGLALLAATVAQAVHNRRLRIALGQAQLNEARLTRSTGRAGQRFGALALVRQVHETVGGRWLYPAPWRTEVAAALAQPDVRVLARWPVPAGHYQGGEEFTADLGRYAAGLSAGGCAIFDTATWQRVRSFPGRPDNPAFGFRFSADGKWFAVGYGDGAAEVWPLAGGDRFALLQGLPDRPPLPEFLPDGSGFIAGQPERGIFRHVFSADPPVRIVAEDVSHVPALPSPDGGRLLASSRQPRGPAVWSMADGRARSAGPPGAPGAEAVAWAPDGEAYASGQGNSPFSVTVVDAANGRAEAQFTDHELATRRVAFHPDGRSLASVSFDGKLVWRAREARGWRVQMDAAQRALQFSADGQRLGFAPSAGELGLLELAPPLVFRAWAAVDAACDCAAMFQVSPDGAHLVTTSMVGVQLWRAGTGELADQFALPAKLPWANALFAPDGRSVFVSALDWGVWRIALTNAEGVAGGLRFGTKTRLGDSAGHMLQELAPDHRSLVVGEPRLDGGNGGSGTRVWLWPDADPARARLLAKDFPLAGLRLLGDGRTGYSTHWSEPDLWLWDTAATNRLRGLGLKLPVNSERSPDGRWLVTATAAESILWDTRDWHRAAVWGGDARVVEPRFSRDGRLLATCDQQGRVTLRTVPDGEELLTLTPTTALRVMDLRFSADAAKLWLLHTSGRLWEWDLAALRRELATFGLDWK